MVLIPGTEKGSEKAPGQTGLELGMKESYGEDLASRSGLEPYADDGNIMGVASARENTHPAMGGKNLLRHPRRAIASPRLIRRLEIDPVRMV